MAAKTTRKQSGKNRRKPRAAEVREEPRRDQLEHSRVVAQPDEGRPSAQPGPERARAQRGDRDEDRVRHETPAIDGRFPPGHSGNPAGRPKGVPNKATLEIKAFCQDLFNRPAFLANLLREWDALTLDPSFRTLLTHYAFGRPATMVDLGPRATASIAKILAGDFDEEDE